MNRLLSTGLNAGSDHPVEVVGGEGCYFLLGDGRRVLDGSNSAGALGHAHPDMVAAIRDAATSPAISEGWFWKAREAAAEEMIDTAFAGEQDWVGAVRFGLSGSEVNDLALSLAQALSGRSAIATRERAYHGLTGLSRDVTVQPHWHGGLSALGGGVRLAAAGAPVRVLSAPRGGLYGGPASVAARELLRDAPAQLADTAAVIVDYSQGGIYHDAAYQDELAGIARRADSLWIADEVITGAGRSGRWFAFQGGTSRPDMVTMGKMLAGGASPIGAVILSRDMVERLDGHVWQAYSTFRGHPLTIAAVRAYLRVLARDRLLDRVAALEPVIAARLLDIAGRHPSVARIDGRGLHWTVELHGPDWRNWRADSDVTPIASRVAGRALENGVVIGTSGEQTSLFLAPALVISDGELATLLDALDHALSVADAEWEARP